ncbi:hypothetical protein [Maricaulis sp. CAU 1757]
MARLKRLNPDLATLRHVVEQASGWPEAAAPLSTAREKEGRRSAATVTWVTTRNIFKHASHAIDLTARLWPSLAKMTRS